MTSPNARYIQWKLELAGNLGATAGVDSVTVAYLPQNTPPVIRGISVTTASGTKSGTSSPAATYTVTVSDAGDTTASSGTSSQTISRTAGQQIVISWQADDPDGDRLLYNV